MKRFAGLLMEYAALLLVLVGVPLACAVCAGKAEILSEVTSVVPKMHAELLAHPELRWNEVCPFAWWAFAAVGLVGCAMIAPFVGRVFRRLRTSTPLTPNPSPLNPHSFPLWAWLGVLVMIAGWVVAWNRFPIFTAVQRHTYLPLWFGFIVAVNGLVYKRSGRSPLTHDTKHYLALFPLSTAFWWFFEYLNRYVWNWFYVGAGEMTPLEYFVFASVSFSTVLPGVTAAAEFLATFRLFGDRSFAGMMRVNFRAPAVVALLTLVTLFGLVGIVFLPEFVYPFLWVSPIMAVILVKVAFRRPCLLDDVASGDWTRVVRYAVAALLCGFVWELWNFHSLAKWIYAVPYVHRFQYFEMPLLGLFGYIPFGVECLLCGAKVDKQ